MMNLSRKQGNNMGWEQVIALFLANAALIVWFRAESRSDNRQCLDLIIAMKDEMKDFHTQLAIQDLEFKTRLTHIEEGKK